MTKNRMLLAAALCLAVSPLTGIAYAYDDVGTDEYIVVPEPETDIITVYPNDGKEYVWVPGNWERNAGEWVWQKGRWAVPPSDAAYWQDGYWRWQDGTWHWVDGHWAIADSGLGWVVDDYIDIPDKLVEKYRPPKPSDKDHWVAGYWDWNGQWKWVSGHWTHKPHPDAKWVDGHWHESFLTGKWTWIGGHWVVR